LVDRHRAGRAEQQRVSIGRRARRNLGPMLPFAPARLSTMTCCFHRSLSFCPTVRVAMSTPPPGANGTIARIGLLG
jgi:hypothetical protein